MDLIFYIGIGVMVASMVALLFAPLLLRPARHERRLLEVVQSDRPDQRTITDKEVVREKVLAVARAFHSRIGFSGDEKLKGKMLSAGIRGPNKIDVFLTARVLAPLAGVAGGSFVPGSTFMWCLVFGGVGYLLPDVVLTRMVKRRQKRIQKSIPDAIDLLVICVEAGLGLDQALLRIGQEIKVSHPELHEEFMQINLEQRAEEAAAKTKIKILFPLVLFIFPCIFIV
ncbi:MAG TPA: hypothetical protein VK670_01580, partial [Silvibacterium sp.]|nr:hypothetical protein [Silvibacterium sp.]